MAKLQDVPPCPCPHCQHMLNGRAHAGALPAEIDGVTVPDVTVCFYCAKVSAFTESCLLRKLSPAEAKVVHRDATIMKAVNFVKTTIEQRREGR